MVVGPEVRRHMGNPGRVASLPLQLMMGNTSPEKIVTMLFFLQVRNPVQTPFQRLHSTPIVFTKDIWIFVTEKSGGRGRNIHRCNECRIFANNYLVLVDLRMFLIQ